MNLKSATFMQSSLYRKVGLMSLFRGRVVADPVLLTGLNLCNENLSSLAPVDAKKSRLVVGLRLPHILIVDLPGRVPKIHPTVVTADTVDVVNAQIGVPALYPQKNQAVLKVSVRGKSENSIADTSNTPGPASIFCPVFAGLSPRKIAVFRVVMKKIAQSLCGKIGVSHDALQMLIGQGSEAISGRFWPRHFTRCLIS